LTLLTQLLVVETPRMTSRVRGFQERSPRPDKETRGVLQEAPLPRLAGSWRERYRAERR
jgi:hypothetical protein